MVHPHILIGSPPKRRRGVDAFSVGLSAAFLLAAALSAGGQTSPLSPDKAFRFTARALNPQTVEARFNIADGYYLYRDKIHFAIEPKSSGLTTPTLPSGTVKEDEFYGKVETYRGNVIVNLDIRDAVAGQQVTVQAESQGCADIGICYPPSTQRVTLALPAANAAPTPANESPKKSWFN